NATTQLVGQHDRVLAVARGARVQVAKVTLTGGNAGATDGGGVVNQGVLLLRRSSVSGNQAQGGGGLYNGPTAWLEVITSTISGNVVTGTGGGLLNDGGTVTVSGTEVLSNTAMDGHGGGIYNSGAMTLTHSTFSGNAVTNKLYAAGGG